MKVQFIINPFSGRNRRRPWLPQAIRDFAGAHLLRASVALTAGPGHATEIARSAVTTGHDVVVAVGGDGTMNEVAQALINTPAALGLVPCGSGNGLALHLRMPRSLYRALHLLRDESARVVSIDTGLVNDRPFFNAMGLGFDAEVSHRFNGLTRRGLPAYIRAGCTALRAVRPQRCTIGANDRRLTLDALLVTVANSDQYGNNARIAPGAHVDDGLLDLVVVKAARLHQLAGLVPSLFMGQFDQSRHVVRIRGSLFTIERPAPGLVHTDGETHEMGRIVTVRVNPSSLRVLVPATSKIGFMPIPEPRSFALQLP